MTTTDTIDRLAVIRDEAQRFADVLTGAPPQARCPSCPDWNAVDLLWHLTEVHHFWAGILAAGALSDAEMAAVDQSKPARPDTVAQMLPIRAAATGALLDQLTALPDDDPRWTWWPAEQTVGFTRRMQTYEATIHRVDAELTAGLPISPLAPAVAGGAVDHCVDIMWGWMPDWADYRALAVAEFVATDSDRRWLVELGHWTGTGPESGKVFDEPRAVRAPDTARPDVTVTAPVTDLALWAWSRGGVVQTAGAPAAVAALEALIANGIQ